MAKAWMRLLEVHLTSTKLKKKFVFGAKQYPEENLNIDVKGYKYMSALKDECVIKLDNLTYVEITQLISGQYYDVEVKAGYKNFGLKTMFKGGVLYISNSLNSDKTHTAIILCTSYMVAKFGQSRLKLSLNSGINLYSAIRFVCRRAGMPNSNVSTQFKKQFLQDICVVNETCGSWLDELAKNNESYIVNSDSDIANSFVTMFDANKSSARIIKLTSNFINLVGGYPQLTNNGLTLSVMPTFSFMCGDIIELDNSIINISVLSKEEMQKNYGYYLDKDGQYMITQMSYHLQNRGANFSIDISAKSRSLISSFSGAKS